MKHLKAGDFIFISLFLVVGSVSALKCYQCRLEDGEGDVGCGENPPPEKYLRECAQPQCWMKYSSNGTFHVERFCVAVATNTNGCIAAMVSDRRDQMHTGLECKCADSDGCNGYSPNIINVHASNNGSHRGHGGREHGSNHHSSNNNNNNNNNNYGGQGQFE